MEGFLLKKVLYELHEPLQKFVLEYFPNAQLEGMLHLLEIRN